MRVLKKENKLCPICMKEHEVLLVEEEEKSVYKEKEVDYIAVHEYCGKADKYFDSEKLLNRNLAACKIAYYRCNDNE